MNNKYTPIIGLEVHVELNTNSKMFCSCSTKYFGSEPNTHTCPVCLGLPGALPVPNKKAIESCVMIARRLNCEISLFSKLDRKNYFYPDLAKGYQISQYDLPFGLNGYVELNSGKKIGVTRVHMEEDTGKLTHQVVNGENVSLIDFNRSGVPLVEIVTEPDFNNAEEVLEYLNYLHDEIEFLKVSSVDMEKGEMRLEPNLSLSTLSEVPSIARREQGKSNKDLLPSYKVEVKNINSFRFVKQAIDFEVMRHTEILDQNETPVQETRGWNEAKQKTFSQRVKEEANDYRYFPEPDIPPFRFSEEEIRQIESRMPESKDEKIKSFLSLGLSTYNANVSASSLDLATFVGGTIPLTQQQNIDTNGTVNYILNRRINDIHNLTHQQVIDEYKQTITLAEVSEQELEAAINYVLTENAKAVEDYKAGKEATLMFLLGQTMRKIGKKVDTNQVKEAIIKRINS